ncbi:hypothetical protein GRI89_06875 [Altererythrobacter salegens]|uniref:Uncharacterized protein n=1 Tax=Croceibacterium salegens TaxID=1737568 RepID=A0A6I4STC4_9SPHN|nr:hypothetical protein [Croceibacterium salegens]MXO59261.1 hypothetical protein [Croceibacterium salegens]
MTTENEIEHIARRMLARTLPKPEWTHRAHFAAALWLLRFPEHLPEDGMPAAIRAYNEATGVANTPRSGFHATITEASLRGAAACLADWPGAPLGEVLDALLASELGTSRWPLTYWSEGRLMSPEARRHWVEPDILPLPWPERTAVLAGAGRAG